MGDADAAEPKAQPRFIPENRDKSNLLIQQALAAAAAGNFADSDEDDKEEEGEEASGAAEEGAAKGDDAPAKEPAASKPAASSDSNAAGEAKITAQVAAPVASEVPVPKAKAKNIGQIEVQLRNVNDYIVCKLCAGYFVNATTIMECLHTFCKSCIVKHFRNSSNCPTCGLTTSETNPLEMLRQDRTIQSMVFKLVKNLQGDEEARESKFYDDHPELERPEHANSRKEDTGADRQPKKRRRTEDEDKQISFKLVGEKIQKLEKPYIKTSAAATIIHIKKFLAKKLELENHDQVDILCNNKLMGEESTLDFIESGIWGQFQASYDEKGKKKMLELSYRNKVDFTPN